MAEQVTREDFDALVEVVTDLTNVVGGMLEAATSSLDITSREHRDASSLGRKFNALVRKLDEID